MELFFFFFFSSRRRHTRCGRDWSSDVCSSDLAILALALAMSAPSAKLQAQTSPGLSVGAAEIGGVVTGPAGPEAGVWVIAETTELPTKYAKIVVTDDQGRYLIPE